MNESIILTTQAEYIISMLSGGDKIVMGSLLLVASLFGVGAQQRMEINKLVVLSFYAGIGVAIYLIVDGAKQQKSV